MLCVRETYCTSLASQPVRPLPLNDLYVSVATRDLYALGEEMNRSSWTLVDGDHLRCRRTVERTPQGRSEEHSSHQHNRLHQNKVAKLLHLG